MMINNPELQEEKRVKNEFVEELIHENIKLMEENIRILLENSWLIKKIEELSSINKTLTGCRDAGEYTVVYRARSGKGKN